MCAPIKSFPSTPTAAAKIITFVTLSPPTVLWLHFNSPVHSVLVFFFFNQISIISCFFLFFSKKGMQCITVSKCLLLGPSSAQRNQKHFFLFFLVVAGGRTACGESCWWGVVGWGVAGCGMPSGGSPTFHVRTTWPSCRRKSCSTLQRERDKETMRETVSDLSLNQ